MEKTRAIYLRSLILSLLWISVVSAFATEINGINYSLNSYKKEASVIGKYLGYSGDIVIPKEVEYGGIFYSVTSIGDDAFAGCSGLTSITIPNSVTSIGDDAFGGCSGLTSITIPTSVTSIGLRVFADCSGLNVEAGNTKYDSRENCNAIIETKTNTLISGTNNTIIPTSVTSIGNSAFEGCSGLTSITIPTSVTSIGLRVFADCDDLTSLNVEAGNTKYDSRDNCNAIIEKETTTLISGTKNTIIPNSVTSIGDYAFCDCSDLTSMTIPNGVTSIGYRAFMGCTRIKSLILPNSLTTIGDDAFHFCGMLSIELPPSITSIGKFAFAQCANLHAVRSLITNPDNIDQYVFMKEFGGWDAVSQYSDVTYVETMYVPEGTKELYQSKIGWNNIQNIKEVDSKNIAFADDRLRKYIVQAGLTEDGTPFYPLWNIPIVKKWDADGDEELSFEEAAAITDIGDVFGWIASFAGVGEKMLFDEFKYFTGVTKISTGALSSISSITIPKSVTTIGENSLITNVSIDEDNPAFAINNNVFYSKDGTQLIRFLDRNMVGTFTLPSIVTTIANSAFRDCSLSSVIIPNSVKTIGNSAFSGCIRLESIEIPNSVTSIGIGVFSNCNNLKSIIVDAGNIIYDSRDNCNAIIHTLSNSLVAGCNKTIIPTNITSIDDSAFGGLSDLSSISIPSGITSIGKFAFGSCYRLSSIILPKSLTSIGEGAFNNCKSLETISIPDGVTSIDGNAFEGCSSLTSITIPNSVTSIGSRAFSNCSGLTSITIPNSVTSIDDFVFSWCSGLTSVTIPNSVTSIGSYAFDSCGGLTSVIVEINTPLSIDEYVFSNRANATLYVPAGSKAAYQAADYWKEFKEIKEMVEPKVKLNKTTAAIEKGKTLTLKATFTPSDFSDKSVTWKSSDTKVATVSSSGKVTGVKAGTATITCTSKATGTKATCTVTIGEVKLDQTEAVIEKDKSLTLKATVYPTSLKDKTVTWKSSDTKVATVTSAGVVKGVKAGTVTITCTSKATKLTATCTVTVGEVKLDKTEAAVEKDKTLTLTATVYPSSLKDKSVTWKSSNTKVATVTSAGKVKGMKAGTATITCTSKATGLTAACTVTVGYVKLDKTTATIEKGNTVTLKATVYPTSLKDKSVTWTSSDKTIATVSSSGKVKGMKAGKVTITCTSKATGLKATSTVTVVNGTVKLDKAEVYVQKDNTVTLTATVTPTSKDKSVTWKSSDTKIATVTSKGKVKGIKYGTVTITCTSKATGAKATCKVTVGKVIISLSEFSLKRSRSNVLTATVYPSTLADKSVTWSSSNTKVATVTAEGKVTGVKAGTATITCTSKATGLKGTCTVTVLQTMGSLTKDGDEIEMTTEINEIEEPAVIEPFDVYDLSGRMVLHQVTSLDGLPHGIYIVNGKKILKK